MNLVPAGIELPENLVTPASLRPLFERPLDPPNEETQKEFFASLDLLPEPLREHLLELVRQPEPGGFREDGFLRALRRYDEILSWREDLQLFARRGQDLSRYGLIDWERDGIVHFEKNRFELAIDEVDLRQIRECSVCGCICFVGRRHYQGKEIEPRCSAKCGKKIRSRRYEANPATRRTGRETGNKRKAENNGGKKWQQDK